MPRRRPPPSASSRDRLFNAACEEFAARGFDGAKVDRIAARAGVNKAMLYYHFPSKAALYREILRDMFGAAAAALAEVRETGLTPAGQLRGYIEALAREGQARPHFPPIWLREIAEGGRHLDADTFTIMSAALGSLAAILADGHRRGEFRQVHPFLIQLGIVGPLMLLLASEPLRRKFAHLAPIAGPALDFDTAVAQIERTTLSALAVEPGSGGKAAPSPKRRKRA